MYVKMGLVESPSFASMTRVLAEQVTPQYVYIVQYVCMKQHICTYIQENIHTYLNYYQITQMIEKNNKFEIAFLGMKGSTSPPALGLRISSRAFFQSHNNRDLRHVHIRRYNMYVWCKGTKMKLIVRKTLIKKRS